MTFTSPKDCVPLSQIMSEFERRVPFVQPAKALSSVPGEDGVECTIGVEREARALRDAYETEQIEAVVAALERCEDGHLILVSDAKGERRVSPGVLRLVPPSWAHSGHFFRFNRKLAEFDDYDMCPIFVPKLFIPQIRSAWASLRSGRPRHPAFYLYEQWAFDRRGRSLKELQRLFEKEVNSAPSVSAIREWEAESRRKHEARSRSIDAKRTPSAISRR